MLNGGWEALELDAIDLLVGAPAPVPLQKGFRAVPVSSAEMLLVVAGSHPLSRLASDPLAVMEQLPNYRRIVTHDTARHNVMRTAGLTTGKQVLHVQTMAQKIQSQLAGLGVGHLPRKLIQSHLDSGALIELTTEVATTDNLERYLAWKISNKGKALKRLSQLLGDALNA